MPDNIQQRRRQCISTRGVIKALTIVVFIAITAVMCVRSGRSLVGMLTRSDPGLSTINDKSGSNLTSRDIAMTFVNSNDGAALEREPNTIRAAAEIRSPETYSADERPLARTLPEQYGQYDGKWQDIYREKNRYDLSNIDKWSSNQYGSGQPDVGSSDPYNFTYGTGDEGVKQSDLLMYNRGTPHSGNQEITNSHMEFTGYDPYFGASDSTSDPDNDRLANRGYQTLPVMYRQPWDTNRQPNHLSYRPQMTHPYPKIVAIPNVVETDWRTIGIAALIKLGLVKLLTTGIIATLLTALFKLKLILVTMFFKFNMLFKFAKFLFIPLQLLPAVAMFLFPMLMSFLTNLLAIPMRIQQMLQMSNAALTSSGSSQFSLPQIVSTGTTQRPLVSFVPPRQEFKEMESNFHQNGNDKLTYLFDNASDIVQMLLDSENCAERIACRLAVEERAGIVPSWISWMLRRVSKFIPNKKLEQYFKTYDDINNDILNTRTSESWSSWCIERYDCNNTNIQHN